MTRNPYAKSLRTKPQQVIPDKRPKSFRQMLDAVAKEEIPERFKRLLDGLE